MFTQFSTYLILTKWNSKYTVFTSYSGKKLLPGILQYCSNWSQLSCNSNLTGVGNIVKKTPVQYCSYLNKAVEHHVKKVGNLADVAPYLCLNWWVHLYTKQHSVQHPYTVPSLMQSFMFINITKVACRTSSHGLKMTKKWHTNAMHYYIQMSSCVR